MRLQHDLARLTQQLTLSDEQRAQVETLLRTHAKDVRRLKAEIQTMALEVLPLLEADPTDFATVKQLVQTITAKKADLRLAQITERQGIRTLLTPEQQQQFRTMPSHMRGHAGMSSRDAKASITVHESRTCAYRNTPCCAPTRGEQCAKVVHAD